MGTKKTETKNENDSSIPSTPMHFITIMWDDEGSLTLDLGDVEYYEARGIIGSVYQEIKDRSGPISVRYNGEEIEDPWLDDGDDEQESEES